MTSRRWSPRINAKRCTGCGVCVGQCPTHVLGLVEGKAVVLHPEDCTYSTLCEVNCPTGAIALPYLILRLDSDRSEDRHEGI